MEKLSPICVLDTSYLEKFTEDNLRDLPVGLEYVVPNRVCEELAYHIGNDGNGRKDPNGKLMSTRSIRNFLHDRLNAKKITIDNNVIERFTGKPQNKKSPKMKDYADDEIFTYTSMFASHPDKYAVILTLDGGIERRSEQLLNVYVYKGEPSGLADEIERIGRELEDDDPMQYASYDPREQVALAI